MLNVIPYNPVAGLPYKTPSHNAQRTFRRILEEGGVSVHFRHRKGDAIDAACGQLRRRSQGEAALVGIESRVGEEESGRRGDVVIQFLPVSHSPPLFFHVTASRIVSW